MEQIKLGNRVRISDPCYGTTVWCAGTIDNVKEGNYNVSIEKRDCGMWGNRVSSLSVIHTDHTEDSLVFSLAEFEVGVDSGQAGIYDEDYYNQYHTEKDCNNEWYEDICDLTYPAGTKDGKCVVSSSGFGDGCYNCFIAKNAEGQVVAITILFITNEDLEDEE